MLDIEIEMVARKKMIVIMVEVVIIVMMMEVEINCRGNKGGDDGRSGACDIRSDNGGD